MGLHDLDGRGRRGFAPETIDDPLEGDDATHVGGQEAQQRATSRAGDGERPAVPRHGEVTEDADLEGRHVATHLPGLRAGV
jgi:hypothetical protein